MISFDLILDFTWLIFLLVMLRYFWGDVKFILHTSHWLKTRGQVVLFEWEKEGHRLQPNITYTYEVSNQRYTSQNLFLDQQHQTFYSRYARGVVYRVAKAYENQEDIDIFYNPDYPAHAALDIKLPKKLALIVVLLIIFILVHLGVMVYRY